MSSNVVVELEVEDGVATITLNRPERKNALSIAMTHQLHNRWEQVDSDPAAKVVILTSSDCGVFCAGMDLKEAKEVKERDGTDILSLFKDPFNERMRQVKKPIIAAMTGSLMAGGMLLSLNSDLRVGLKGTKVGITEVKVGRGSPWAAPLLWMLPQPILMELVITGELLPIEQLAQYGFVNYLEDTPDAVRARATALARTIVEGAPLSVMAAKASVLATMSLGCDQGFQEALRLHEPVYASEDAIEGPRAFAEKRDPQWRGR